MSYQDLPPELRTAILRHVLGVSDLDEALFAGQVTTLENRQSWRERAAGALIFRTVCKEWQAALDRWVWKLVYIDEDARQKVEGYKSLLLSQASNTAVLALHDRASGAGLDPRVLELVTLLPNLRVLELVPPSSIKGVVYPDEAGAPPQGDRENATLRIRTQSTVFRLHVLPTFGFQRASVATGGSSQPSAQGDLGVSFDAPSLEELAIDLPTLAIISVRPWSFTPMPHLKSLDLRGASIPPQILVGIVQHASSNKGGLQVLKLNAYPLLSESELLDILYIVAPVIQHLSLTNVATPPPQRKLRRAPAPAFLAMDPEASQPAAEPVVETGFPELRQLNLSFHVPASLFSLLLPTLSSSNSGPPQAACGARKLQRASLVLSPSAYERPLVAARHLVDAQPELQHLRVWYASTEDLQEAREKEALSYATESRSIKLSLANLASSPVA